MLAHHLGMTVTGEAVETAAQAVRLTAIGCDLAQGWHFAAAGPADRVHRMAVAAGAVPRAPAAP